jgi:hypothetical protein
MSIQLGDTEAKAIALKSTKVDKTSNERFIRDTSQLQLPKS